MSEVVINSPQINQVVIEEDENLVVVGAPISAVTTIIAQGPQGPAGGSASDIVTGKQIGRAHV